MREAGTARWGSFCVALRCHMMTFSALVGGRQWVALLGFYQPHDVSSDTEVGNERMFWRAGTSPRQSNQPLDLQHSSLPTVLKFWSASQSLKTPPLPFKGVCPHPPELEAAGHMDFRLKKQMAKNASCCSPPFSFRQLYSPGQQPGNGATHTG